MKKFIVLAEYIYSIDFEVMAETPEEVKFIIKNKVKVMNGSVNTFSTQIKNWTGKQKPAPSESRILKIIDFSEFDGEVIQSTITYDNPSFTTTIS